MTAIQTKPPDVSTIISISQTRKLIVFKHCGLGHEDSELHPRFPAMSMNRLHLPELSFFLRGLLPERKELS